MKILITLSRILVGSLFIVSGLIKSNDAWGFFYKLEEYFQPGAFNMEYMNDYALGLAIFLCVAEVLLGIAILTGAKARLTVVLTLIMMVFFTFLTYYTSTCDPLGMTEITGSDGTAQIIANQCVTECGCFGNAIPLTAWESFIKDLVILIFCIPILFGAFTDRIRINTSKEDTIIYTFSLATISLFSLGMLDWLFPVIFTALCLFVASVIKRKSHSKHREWVIALGITVICSIFQWYTLAHLPLKDYRPYAIGEDLIKNRMSADELGLPSPIYATVYTIKHQTSGKDSTLLSTDYLKVYNQDWFKNNWKIVPNDDAPSILIEEGYEPSIMDFQIVNYDGDELTDEILNKPGYKFIHVSNTLEETHACGQEVLNALAKEAEVNGVLFFALTNGLYGDVEEYRHEHQTPYPFYNCDQTELKIIVRSNPGLLLLKDAEVIRKWAWSDFPTWEEVSDLMD